MYSLLKNMMQPLQSSNQHKGLPDGQQRLKIKPVSKTELGALSDL